MKRITNRQRVEVVKKTLAVVFPKEKFIIPRAHTNGKIFINWIDGPSVNEVMKAAYSSGLINSMEWKRSFSCEKAQIIIDQIVNNGASPCLFEITRSHWCKGYLPRIVCSQGLNQKTNQYENEIHNLIKGWNMSIK